MAITLKQVFTGTPQSSYAGLAIVVAIVAICLNILLNNNDLSVGEKLVMIITMVVLALPAILLSLFELTCISNNNVKHSLCGIYGWVISILIIVYCILVVFMALSSMFTYNSALSKDQEEKEVSKPAMETSNNMAKEMMGDYTKPKEGMGMGMNIPSLSSPPEISSLSPDFGGYMGTEYSTYQ